MHKLFFRTADPLRDWKVGDRETSGISYHYGENSFLLICRAKAIIVPQFLLWPHYVQTVTLKNAPLY